MGGSAFRQSRGPSISLFLHLRNWQFQWNTPADCNPLQKRPCKSQVINEIRYGGATYVSTGRGLPTDRRPFIGEAVPGKRRGGRAEAKGGSPWGKPLGTFQVVFPGQRGRQVGGYRLPSTLSLTWGPGFESRVSPLPLRSIGTCQEWLSQPLGPGFSSRRWAACIWTMPPSPTTCLCAACCCCMMFRRD